MEREVSKFAFVELAHSTSWTKKGRKVESLSFETMVMTELMSDVSSCSSSSSFTEPLSIDELKAWRRSNTSMSRRNKAELVLTVLDFD